jgi:hypothetical protein
VRKAGVAMKLYVNTILFQRFSISQSIVAERINPGALDNCNLLATDCIFVGN